MLGFDYFGGMPAREGMPKAKAAALRALELDDSLAEAHSPLGVVSMLYDWDWAAAEQRFRRALQLKPSYIQARIWYSLFLSTRKRHEESLEISRRAVELEPVSLLVHQAVSRSLHYAGRHEEAIEQCRRLLDMDPSFVTGYETIARPLCALGRYSEAEEAVKEGVAHGFDSDGTILRRCLERAGPRVLRWVRQAVGCAQGRCLSLRSRLRGAAALLVETQRIALSTRCCAGLLLLSACSGGPIAPAPPSPVWLPATSAEAARRVETIADDFYRRYVQSYPVSAFLRGVPEAAPDRMDENSLEALARWREQEDVWLSELRLISPALLGETPEAVTYTVLRTALESSVARRVCRDELWPARQQGGSQRLPTLLAALQPVGTAEQRAQALARLRSLAPYLDTEIDNLREGARRGYTSPRGNVEAVIEQLDGLLESPPERSPVLLLAERDSAPGFRDQVTDLLRESLYPAVGRYRTYLASEYLPRARHTIAITALPHGGECYRARVLGFTTLDIEPETIHRLGLEEMARIEREMRIIAERELGSSDLPALLHRLRTDPGFEFGSRQEVLDTAAAALARVRARLPQWFGRLPRAEMVLDPCLPFEERTGCPNSYLPAAHDGSRPARWRINTSPDRASRVDLESIAFHEGYPGHHLEVALAQELEGAHPVTRIIFNSGFAEGWGLYAEQLASEMGAYSGDLAQLGRLSSAAFRAARLVVDPGLHVLGWSRERAIEYMLAHTVLSRGSVESEVDRYIINPGQATAYMVGRLEIDRLRRAAEDRLGPEFEVRTFHDRVLANGRVPLPFLRRQIERWIAAAAPAASP